jgi:tRNA threonylcarbamoyladenosine biosynthesis protein TsaB
LNILALETSSPWCSVALWRDGSLSAREELAGQTHSELLLPMARALLSEAGVAAAQIAGVAFGAGPGSFTGLRIACGVAQGIAAGVGAQTIGVGTLAAVAEQCAEPRVLVCLDARMGELYYAAYERGTGGWMEVAAPRLCVPGSAPDLPGEGWIGVGSGFEAHGDALLERHAGQIAEVRADLHPRAHEIASLGARMIQAGHGVAPEHAHPFYLRDHVAMTIAERAARREAEAEARR